MRRSRINLIAALVVALGGAHLTARPASADETPEPQCVDTSGKGGCVCSGGGLTCQGDSCGADENGCWIRTLEDLE
jgi:hypothetical protein